MSEHPWTPGEWCVVVSNGGRSVSIRTALTTVASVTARMHREANARLIALAPKLYDALEAMLPENCDLGDDPSGGCRPSFEKCERARAALAKARGETP